MFCPVFAIPRPHTLNTREETTHGDSTSTEEYTPVAYALARELARPDWAGFWARSRSVSIKPACYTVLYVPVGMLLAGRKQSQGVPVQGRLGQFLVLVAARDGPSSRSGRPVEARRSLFVRSSEVSEDVNHGHSFLFLWLKLPQICRKPVVRGRAR